MLVIPLPIVRLVFVPLCALGFALSPPWLCSAEVRLVRQGEPQAVLVLPVEPTDEEHLAALEINEHLKLMSGADLPIVTRGEEPAGQIPIRIGRAAEADLEKLIRRAADDRLRFRAKAPVTAAEEPAADKPPRSNDPESFALVVEETSVSLRGLSPAGTLHAAIELLEQLGVRWFLPGELGRVIPERENVSLSTQQTVQIPSFQYRQRVRSQDEWNRRMRLGGVGRRPGAHGIPPLRGSAAPRFFASNPELFALRDGDRVRRQLCISNPEVLRLTVDATRKYFRENPAADIIHMGPNDGGGFCQCDACRALDADLVIPFKTPEPAMTDRYVWFYNRVLAEITDEFPEKKLGFYAYGSTMTPPVRHPLDRRMAVSIAPIHICRMHGPNNPVCPESEYFTWLYRQWRTHGSELWDRGYWFNLACPGFPFPMVHRLREEIPLGHELGIVGWGGDMGSEWASHTPSMYIAAKLMWDHRADVDALLDEFYHLFYGPAAEPMGSYHRLLDAALRDGDHHTGSSWDLPHLYSPEVRHEAQQALDAARALAGEGVYRRRVQAIAASFQYFDAFAAMMDQRSRHDFVAAHESLERIDALRTHLLEDYEIPMLRLRTAERFLDRFFRPATEQGFAWVSGGNELVAPLDDVWQFLIDPQNIGHQLGLDRPRISGGNWRPLRSSTSSWGNQGLRYYFGQAWYRQSVTIPEQYAGRAVHLWFGGVDDAVDVWVNGRLVGSNHAGAVFDLDAHGASFKPFEFDATQAVRFGEPNVVTVRARRGRSNELGTGGIVAPVMFYAPAETPP